MRRFWVIVLGAALVLSLSSPGASAQPERYASRSTFEATYPLRTDKLLRLRDTEEANMSQGESMSITHEC